MEHIFSMEWFTALGSILLLDIVLSGDNAILIALACKNLGAHRLKAMIIGGAGAVFIRIVCTLFATGLLSIPYLEFLGGAALLYIAVRLLIEHGPEEENQKECQPANFWAAVKTILAADFLMSIDNVLSLAGVANTVPEGKWSLIICGLMISIPIVLCGAQFFLLLMLKLPVIIYFGAAILACTAAKMMVMDEGVGPFLLDYAWPLQIVFVLLVISIGWYMNHRRR